MELLTTEKQGKSVPWFFRIKLNGAQNNYYIDDPHLSLQVIEVAGECPNMYLIASGTTVNSALKVIKTLGARGVCFGSDVPFEFMHVRVAEYTALLKTEVSQQEKLDFFGGNVVRLFGI